MDAHRIIQQKCRVSCEGSIPVSGSDGFLVRLFEAQKAPGGFSLVCAWEFYPSPDRLTGFVLDFSRVDVHAVRAETARGLHPAHRFSREKNAFFSEKMILDVVPILSAAQAFPLFQCELHLSAEETRRLNLHRKAITTAPVQWFFLELTNRCNFHCKWCPQRKMTRDLGTMTYENARVVLEKIAAYKNKYPEFSLYAEIRNPVFLHVMGEPLLHPRFFDILEYGHDLGLDFCLVTNGSLLKEPAIERILKSRLKSMIVSLNMPDAVSFLQTGSTLHYDEILGNLKNLILQRSKYRSPVPRIEIQLLNTKEVEPGLFTGVSHIRQVEQALMFWSDFVREQEQLWSIAPPALGWKEEMRWQEALNEKGLTPGVYFQLGQNIFLVFKQGVNFGNTLVEEDSEVIPSQNGRCPFHNAHRTFCILWDGSCTFCSLDYNNSVNLENVFANEIEEIWLGEKMNRIRALMENDILIEPLCRQCQGKIVKKTIYQ